RRGDLDFGGRPDRPVGAKRELLLGWAWPAVLERVVTIVVAACDVTLALAGPLRRGRLVLGPADAVPGDLVQRQPRVLRHRRDQLLERLLGGLDTKFASAAAARQLRQHRPAGADLARMSDRDPQTLDA